MIKELYVFANLGNLNRIPKSGGQSSARRVINGLEKLGYNVHPIVKHRSELKGKVAHFFEVFFFAGIDLLKICCSLLFKNRKDSAFMMLTYAGSLVPFEWLISKTVRGLGFKCVYYLKGGKLIDSFASGSERHTRLFKQVIKMQDLAFFEGIESQELVKSLSLKTPLVYFPNYILEEQIESYHEKPHKPIGVLYFGRVTPEKNVHVSLEAFSLLCKKYPDIHLTIIGGSTRAVQYTAEIGKRVQESPYSERITQLGNSPFETIQEAMRTNHFFIFPSHEKAEGHSNSLNEAMSQGLIPVVSDWHFNRGIVGNDKLVVKGYAPKDYADKIDGIISANEIECLSRQMYERIKTHFAENVVLKNVHEALQKYVC